MTTLYNCKHAGDEYRITKWDHDMNVVSSYLCTYAACDCPAGVRDTCRHRQMLPKFIQRNAVGSHWMYDYDRDGWVQTDLGEALSGSVEDLTAEDIEAMPDGLEKDYHHEVQDVALATAGTATASVDTTGSEAQLDRMMGADADSWERLEKALAPAKPFRRGL